MTQSPPPSLLVALTLTFVAAATACSSSSAPASTPDSASPAPPHAGDTPREDASPSVPDAQTGCVNFAAGSPCAPIGTACPVPGCLTWFCASGMWVAEPLCDAAGVMLDALVGGLDGSVSVDSCAACPPNDLCVVTVRVEGGCLLRDGSACDDTFVSYACQDVPAACTGAVTCGCAGQVCGAGSAVCGGDAGGVDAGGVGPVLVCRENDH